MAGFLGQWGETGTGGAAAERFLGNWDASTNTPTITSSLGTQGDFYRVSVAGSTNIDGTSTWAIGDRISFNGSVWQRLANTGVEEELKKVASEADVELDAVFSMEMTTRGFWWS